MRPCHEFCIPRWRWTMGQDGTFRMALLVVLAITIAITAFHRMQARAAGGSVSRREEGFVLLAMRAVCGLSIWVAIIAYLVSPGSMAWAALPAAEWLRWGGVALGLLACGLLYWTLHHLGTNLTDTSGDAGESNAYHQRPFRLGTPPVLHDCVAAAPVSVAHHGQLVHRPGKYLHFCILHPPYPA